MSTDQTTLEASFGAYVRDHLSQVEDVNAEVLDAVADRLYAAVTNGQRVFTAGTGHSLGFVLETFYRAGGLACVVPVYHPGLLPLHGGPASTLVEHTAGLARELVRPLAPVAGDLAFIASQSGVNAVPVELAEEFLAAGTTVVALSSRLHAAHAPSRVGRNLVDVAPYVLDTRVPYGDAVYPAGDATTAGLSSLSNVHLWNLLLVRLARRAAVEGVELPLWTSSNVVGGQERNARLLARYRPSITAL